MYIFLVCLFLGLFFLLSWKKIDWALMFVLIALPTYLIRFKLIGIPFTFLEGMILIAFFVWFLKKTNFFNFLKGEYSLKDFLKNRKQRFPYPFAVEIILVLVVSLVSVAMAKFSDASLGVWKAYFFEPILFFILFINIFQNKKDFKKIVFALTIGAFLVSLYAIFQWFTGIGIVNEFWANPESRRVVSFFGYPNAVGLYLAPILVFLSAYLYKNISQNKLWENILLILTIILGLASMYFAKSEGAMLAFLFSMFVFGLLADKVSRIIVLSFLVLSLGFVFVNKPIKEYVFQKATLMDLSGQIRRQQWKETWEMLRDGRIFWGVGLSSYQESILPYHQEGIFVNPGDPDFKRKIFLFNDEYKAKHWQPTEVYMYPHNIVLNFWTELGILGVLIFVWLFVKFIYLALINFLKNKKDSELSVYSLAILGAILAILIHGLVDVPYFKNDLSVLFWMFFALLGIINISRKYKK